MKLWAICSDCWLMFLYLYGRDSSMAFLPLGLRVSSFCRFVTSKLSSCDYGCTELGKLSEALSQLPWSFR